MFGKKLAIALSSLFIVAACFGCAPENGEHKEHVDADPQDGICDVCGEKMEASHTTHVDEDKDGKCDVCGEEMETSHTAHVDENKDGKCDVCGEAMGETPVDPDTEKFDVADYKDLPEVQFSSLRAVQAGGSAKFKMRAAWADTYQLTFSEKAVSLVEIFDESGKTLKSETANFEITLEKDQVVYVRVVPVKQSVRVTVQGKENAHPLPFDLVNVPDASQFATTSDSAKDPLEAAEINYVKRKDTRYVYSNAPETLVPEVINKCQTRQDVSDMSVYFTFEHQSRDVGAVWYGYRVTNQGDEDMYVTVRNVGFQLDGKGAYLGEKEWIDFYNTKFELPDLDSLTESQRSNYKAWYDFAGNYTVNDYQPTTYRIPAGKFMYVIGGTTQDAFDSINVAGTANRKSANAVVENGAVVFDVVGKAEGAFYIYNDISKVAPGTEGCDSHLGGTIQPAASCGYDEGYVVDNQATWIFNDATEAQALPVNYTNYYSDTVGTDRNEADGVGTTGTPNSKVENTQPHHQLNKREWVTHIDVQQHHEAVGTDVTTFHTVDKDGNPIVYGCNYYDSVGKLPNMGNWMKGFIDIFTFVNQGDKERTVTINIVMSGGMPVMLRTMDGKRVMEPGLSPFYAMNRGSSEYGDGFDLACHYKIKVPAHSVVQYAVEYNLMANSNGYVRHSVDLL